jgi:hypothetical protein
MFSPDFSHTPEDHIFEVGDEIYVIDGNKVDLLEGCIKKRYSRGYLVHFKDEEEEDSKFKDNQRLLLRNEVNNRIFASQQKLRKRYSRAPATPAPEEDELELDSPPTRAKRSPRRTRVRAITPEQILKTALAAGIKTPESLRALMAGQTEAALKLFDNHFLQLSIDVKPLFQLGGGHSPEEVAAFWRGTKAQWIELFGTEVRVGIEQFIQKVSEAWRGTDLDGPSARTLLQKTFGFSEEVSLAEFCSFLAEFGPISTILRKLDQYWSCPSESRDALQPVDLGGFEDLSVAVNEEGNSFEIETVGGMKTVYNLVTVDADGQFLIDGQGRRYASWNEFCEANPPMLGDSEDNE